MEHKLKMLVRRVKSAEIEKVLIEVVDKLLAKGNLTTRQNVRLWACQDLLVSIGQLKED